MDMLSNRQPMQFLKNWGDMIILSNICHYVSCTILNSLKVIDVTIRYAIQHGVTIVYMRCAPSQRFTYNTEYTEYLGKKTQSVVCLVLWKALPTNVAMMVNWIVQINNPGNILPAQYTTYPTPHFHISPNNGFYHNKRVN